MRQDQVTVAQAGLLQVDGDADGVVDHVVKLFCLRFLCAAQRPDQMLLTINSRGISTRVSTPFSVTSSGSLISTPQSFIQIPGMKWKAVWGCSMVLSPGLMLMVCSPQSGG